ncbi:EAL-associated domain-containing protein [Bacillus sp. JCM 19034]|uniref:EAL domain-containing protein n=1 Tax=Bacillus sp. JCM 19034 TaxID=1481928 RepID=UPI000786633B|nr:EAL-associated domain-containing protein [Bacillus sp. JCM 19034]
MDPLDIMMNKEKIKPYFQAVVSADKQLVIGYEVIPKYQSGNDFISLDWFFQDSTIPDEYRLELYDYIQMLAFEELQREKQSVILYFHYDVELLVKDQGETFLKRLSTFEKDGFSYDNFAIQFKSDEIVDKATEYKHFFFYLQSLGLRIVIEELGQSTSSLDHIVQLKPNVIKTNVSFIDEEELPHMFGEVHQTLSILSRKIGATLLFSGISNFNQLNYAWRNGGRYYQGDYIQSPRATFVPLDCSTVRLRKSFNHFLVYERRKIEAQVTLTNELNTKLRESLKLLSNDDAFDEMLMKVAQEFNQYAFRLYICNAEGFQQSSNAQKNENNEWVLLEEGRYKNWSWRPYFLENIVRMSIEKKGILSDLYTDIERDERIRTYSYPISDELYLFLDIPYDYLFEQEGLL